MMVPSVNAGSLYSHCAAGIITPRHQPTPIRAKPSRTQHPVKIRWSVLGLVTWRGRGQWQVPVPGLCNTHIREPSEFEELLAPLRE